MRMLGNRIITRFRSAIWTDLKLTSGSLPGIHKLDQQEAPVVASVEALPTSTCSALAEKWAWYVLDVLVPPLDQRAETVFSVLTQVPTHGSHSTVNHPNKCFLAIISGSRGKVNQIRILGTGLRERTKQSCSAASGPGLGVPGVTSFRDKAWPQSWLRPMRFQKARVVEQGKGR